jgi:uncharacterized protein (DUF1778 family)
MYSPDEEAELLTLMVTPEEKERLATAAAFLGVTVEEFVVMAAREAALRATAMKEPSRQKQRDRRGQGA